MQNVGFLMMQLKYFSATEVIVQQQSMTTVKPMAMQQLNISKTTDQMFYMHPMTHWPGVGTFPPTTHTNPSQLSAAVAEQETDG